MYFNKTYARWGMLILLLLGSGLRMFQLGQIPPGFYFDEASESYDAFSIWHTGHDQHGAFFPLALRSFNDYRPPLFSYTLAPLVGLAGLSVFVARIASVFWGVLSIATLYWVGSLLFTRDVGLISSVLLTIAPWHVHFSRLSIEVNMAAFLVMLAIGMFYRWQRKPTCHWLWLSASIAALGLYTYSSVKMTLPIIIGIMVIMFWEKIVTRPRDLISALVLGGLICAPVLYLTLTNYEIMQDHFQQISIFQPGRSAGEILAAVTLNFWANISPRYLFSKGSLDIVMHPPGMGQLFTAQVVGLVFGVIGIVKRREWQLPGRITLLWVVTSILPATLTRHLLGTGHAQRTYPVVIAWQLLSAVGFVELYSRVKDKILQKTLVLAISGCILSQGSIYYHYYFTNYVNDSSVQFYAGADELVNAIDEADDDFHAVYFTTYGNDHPYIHFLFYSKYDPWRLLEDSLVTDPTHPDRVIQMGKYTFTDQVKDLYLSGLPGLFVLPYSDLPDVAGLYEIPGPVGSSAYKIVSRESIMIDTSEWLGQCTEPVAPLTYSMVAPKDGEIWLANFDCSQTWIYPQAGESPQWYILHQDIAAQMNNFTLRHIDGSQKVLSLDHQIRSVGAFTAYEQKYVPDKPSPVKGVVFPAETVPGNGLVGVLDSVTFGEKFTFLGVFLYPEEEQLEIETWWYVVHDDISRPASIMAHWIDESGRMIGNADGLGLSPLVLREGDYFVQRHIFHNPSIQQKTWLRLGVYWLDTMERWTISAQERTDALFVKLSDN